jgi:hypothetical protein
LHQKISQSDLRDFLVNSKWLQQATDAHKQHRRNSMGSRSADDIMGEVGGQATGVT